MPSLTGITVMDSWIFNNGTAIFFKTGEGEPVVVKRVEKPTLTTYTYSNLFRERCFYFSPGYENKLCATFGYKFIKRVFCGVGYAHSARCVRLLLKSIVKLPGDGRANYDKNKCATAAPRNGKPWHTTYY